MLALCDLVAERAEKRREEFFPEATVHLDVQELLRREDVEVVDVATHPPSRVPLIEAAIRAKKHVLSQKPFVVDLETGERLADLADKSGIRLAVNQNGRWAPHWSYLRHAVNAGLVGTIAGAHCRVHWDHNWVAGTEFENVKHLILYDFAIHWFDFLSCIFREARPRRVYASECRAPGQKLRPSLQAQALVEFDEAQASLVFGGDTHFGAQDTTLVQGTSGSISSTGPDLNQQQVTLQTAEGECSPKLRGRWFDEGFHGTMAELLLAIEEGREPSNNARDNLRSLRLCFAAIESAVRNEPVDPATVQRLPMD